jgi:hypothetical protein
MIWDPPLGWCIVDCDGSGCGSGDTGWHTHQPQFPPWWVQAPVARARVEHGHVTYTTDTP